MRTSAESSHNMYEHASGYGIQSSLQIRPKKVTKFKKKKIILNRHKQHKLNQPSHAPRKANT